MKNAAALGLTKEKTIPPSTGIHLLELTLMEQQPHFAIFPAAFLPRAAGSSKVTSDLVKEVRGQSKKLSKSKKAPPKKASKKASKKATKKSKKSTGSKQADLSLLGTLAASSKSGRSRVMQDFIIGEISRVMSKDKSKINVRKPFNDVGFDSLMGIEFRNALSEAVEAELHTTLIFDYANVEALAMYLVDEVIDFDSIEVSDDETEDEEEESTR